MKKLIYVLLAMALILTGCAAGSVTGNFPNGATSTPTSSGSTSTPTASVSGIQGIIALGPICPVQRVPADPACADKPYQATVAVKTADGQQEISRFTSAADGSFKVELAPGEYLLQPEKNGAAPYPAGQPLPVTVLPDGFTKVNLVFDTGIR